MASVAVVVVAVLNVTVVSVSRKCVFQSNNFKEKSTSCIHGRTLCRKVLYLLKISILASVAVVVVALLNVTVVSVSRK